MKIYGLTGGIASGKSAAADRFSARGIPVVDADRIGHDVIAPGGAAEQAVRAAFGESVLSCGRIDREKLGTVVFGTEEHRRRLNALVHPIIFEEIGRRCRANAEQGAAATLIDAALLCEGGAREPWLDGVVLILASNAERIRRMMEMRQMTREEAERRLAAQTKPEQKIPLADWVIENDGGWEQLHAAVDKIAEVMLRNAGRT